MAPTIKAEGAFYSASDEARISHVDVGDIAAVEDDPRILEQHMTAIDIASHPARAEPQRIRAQAGAQALVLDAATDANRPGLMLRDRCALAAKLE